MKCPIDSHYILGTDYNLKIALLSDIHECETSDILISLRKNSPNLICISGDFVIGNWPLTNVPFMSTKNDLLYFLEQCTNITTTVVSLGNHEWMLDEDDIAIIHSTGVRVLNNEWIEVKNVYIAGLTSGFTNHYWKYRKEINILYPKHITERYPFSKIDIDMQSTIPEYKWLLEFEKLRGYKILLSHHPEYWNVQPPYLSQFQIDLVLSGHAHGGQISIFNRGLYAPGQGFFPKYTSGIHKSRYGKMIISRGLRNTYRWIPRIHNPLEIVYINI